MRQINKMKLFLFTSDAGMCYMLLKKAFSIEALFSLYNCLSAAY